MTAVLLCIVGAAEKPECCVCGIVVLMFAATPLLVVLAVHPPVKCVA